MKTFIQFLEMKSDIWTLWRLILSTQGKQGVEELKSQLASLVPPDLQNRVPMFFDALDRWFAGDIDRSPEEFKNELRFLTEIKPE